MYGTVVGMWRMGSYTQLDPDAILDSPAAAPDVSTSALHLARQQGRKISWQQANPKTPSTGTWTRYEAYKHVATIESAKACGCTTGNLPQTWKRRHMLLHDPALKGDGTPLAHARATIAD